MAKSSVKVQSKHNPSVLLSWEENNSIFSLLSRGQTALATAVIQLLITSPPMHNEWQLYGTGVMCFVKDNQKRTYYFRFYDFDQKISIWEQEIYLDLNYLKPDPLFHMFEAHNCLAAFNFADQTDAQNFSHIVKTKADLINRMLRPKEKPKKVTNHMKENNSLQVPSISSMRARSLDSLQPNNKKSKNKNKSKLNISKLEIGLPFDFRHIQHIGWSPSTGFDFNVSDPKLQNFFEIAGVSAAHLEDVDTRKFIFDFIDNHGGIETAIQEATEQKKKESIDSKKSSTKSAQSVKSPVIAKRAASPSPSPIGPPPPPPPPPPLTLPPMPQSINIQSSPGFTEELKTDRNLNQIDSYHSSNTSEVGDSRNALLEQIRGGVSLKSTKKVKSDSQKLPSTSANSSGTLADALSKALQNRFRANQMVRSLSDDSDDNDDEFDCDEWND